MHFPTFSKYPLVLWALVLYLCSLGVSLTYDLPLAFLAAAFAYAVMNSRHAMTAREFLRIHWPVICFLLITAVVTWASRDVLQSLRVQIQLLPALLVYFTIVFWVEEEQQQNFLVASVVLAGMLAQLIFMTQALYLTETPDRLQKMWLIRSPLFVAPNDVLFFSVLAPLAAWLLFVAAGWKRLLALAYLLLTLVTTIYMQSRQAVGVYLGGLFLMALLWRPMAGLALVGGGTLLVLGVDWLTGKALLNKLVYLFPRRYVWEAAWQMFLDRPWVGHGPGMFKIYYLEYLEKAGYLLEQVEDRRPMNWAHSLYLEQLAERGVCGLLALACLVGTALARLFIPVAGGGDLLGRALLSAWVAFLAAGVAESSLLRLWALTTLLLLFGLTTSIFIRKSNK